MLEYQFQCHECGYKTAWTMEDVIDKGAPVCMTLDTPCEGDDMVLDGVSPLGDNAYLRRHLVNIRYLAIAFMDTREVGYGGLRPTADIEMDEATDSESIQVIDKLINSIPKG